MTLVAYTEGYPMTALDTRDNTADGCPLAPPGPEGEGDAGGAGVVGNGRLIALAGVILLALLLVQLATTANLGALLPVHIVVGVLLAGPLVVKLGATGYRFLRYYTGAPAYVRKGPPRLPLRLLAPLLVGATLAVVGSGIGLVVVGPARVGFLRQVHTVSVLLWLALLVLHVVPYLGRALRWIADDWRADPAAPTSGRGLRLGASLGALLAGAAATVLLSPGIAPWVTWMDLKGGGSPDTLIEGLVLAAVALLAFRPRRWR